MLVVKTKIGPSKIEVIGLFADQFIPKGTIIWKFDPKFDIFFEPSAVDVMPQIQKDLIIRFAYLSKKSGKYVFSIDNTRFTNHSIDPNVIEDEKFTNGDEELPTVAARDIQIGEEMTLDYREIDAADENSDEEYLKGTVI